MDSLVASLRAKQLYLVQCIEKICDSHHIKYFLVGGSLLGAVKYGTFIEGDKDIDIGMLRNDYERFISLADEELPEDVRLLSAETTKEYNWPFCKVHLPATTLMPKKDSQIGLHIGIYVDICPYDSVPKNKIAKEIIRLRSKINKWMLLVKTNSKSYSGIKFNVIRYLSKLQSREDLIKSLSHETMRETGLVQNLVGGTKNDWFFTEEIEHLETLRFAGLTLPIPQYRRYLDLCYPNWETKPMVRNELDDYEIRM